MLQEWLARLPQDIGPRGLMLALIAAGVGLVLWVVGARFSRSIFTLLGVAAGTWVGMRVPRWMGWEIDAMAVAIGGALVLGLIGYLLHIAWVGLTLGTLIAAASSFVVWHRLGGEWSMPAFDPTQPATDTVRKLLPTIPMALRCTLAGGLIAGGLLAWVWPKMGRVLAFSLLGSALLAGGGVVAVALGRPQWLGHLPTNTQTQGVALAILVVVGAAFQWALCPRVQKTDEDPPKRRGPQDVKDLGESRPGPLKLWKKEVRA
jgi:hypothetical protein